LSGLSGGHVRMTELSLRIRNFLDTERAVARRCGWGEDVVDGERRTRAVSYLLLEAIYWGEFDPAIVPVGVKQEEPAQMVLRPGLVQGRGLMTLLGSVLFDRCVEAGVLEPIP
jgi:hypothetical protein